jgi:uncharacterized protein YndB with AHSA1/START domain
MPADAEAVFDVLTDLDNMTAWLPDSVEIELSGPNLIRLWFPGRHAGLDVERRVAIDWDRLRITWGTESTTSCSGTVQVLRLAAGRSAVSVRLTGPPGTSPGAVAAWLDAALDALDRVVAAECRSGRKVHHTAR